MRRIDEIFIHCSATPPAWMSDRPASEQRDEIRRWHVDERGWSDIGYHYVIGRGGEIERGRPEARQGAHVRGRNRRSIGICLVGGHGSSAKDQFFDHFTVEQEMALNELLSELQEKYPKAKVRGHNEVAAKACPGFDVQRWLGRPSGKAKADKAKKELQIASMGGVGTLTAGGTAIGSLDGNAQLILIGALVVAGLAFAWIARDRISEWAEGE